MAELRLIASAAEMVAVFNAADAVACNRAAHRCEVDHRQPYRTGGHTGHTYNTAPEDHRPTLAENEPAVNEPADCPF
jgi:hypothetical protein